MSDVGRRTQGSAAGFSLAELVISLSIMGVLMAGLGSAILVGSHALPEDPVVAYGGITAAEVADLIAEELRPTRHIVAHTDTSIKVTLPDSDGDAAPDWLSYTWRNFGAKPLLRQDASGGLQAMLSAAELVEFELALRSVDETYPAPLAASAEVLLASETSYLIGRTDSINTSHWVAQTISPALPAEAVAWTVTRVYLAIQSSGSTDGVAGFQLRTTNEFGEPTNTVLASGTTNENVLPGGYSWYMLPLSDVGMLETDEEVAVVAYGAGAGTCMQVLSDGVSGHGAWSTYDGGENWSGSHDTELMHYVFGNYYVDDGDQTSTHRFVTQISTTIQPGRDTDARIVTGARLLNQPELLSGLWEADFSIAPTEDFNGDGEPDWVRTDGLAFDADTLVDGVWRWDAALMAYPQQDLNTLTTIELRLRATSVGGYGATCWISADGDATQCAALLLHAIKQADGTQTVQLRQMTSSSDAEVLRSVSEFGDGMIAVRLLIDPTHDTVNLQLDGEDYGTYSYGRITLSAASRSTGLMGWNASAEFDYVSIRAGG